MSPRRPRRRARRRSPARPIVLLIAVVIGLAVLVGGLTQAQIDQVESLAARIADAVTVRRIGTPFDVTEAVSNVKSYGEGPVMIWFLEDYRDDVVLVVRVQHFELSDP